MIPLIHSIDKSLETENWLGALFVALTLPDIAGKIDNPDKGSNFRYAKWFETYCGDKYKVEIGGVTHVFLSGNDCYALRCSYLHEGHSKIDHQRARDVLDDFQFNTPDPAKGFIHNNKFGNSLQLQIDTFCLDIRDGIVHWLESLDEESRKLLNESLHLQPIFT